MLAIIVMILLHQLLQPALLVPGQEELILKAVPQENHIYLTWSSVRDVANYTLKWRRADVSAPWDYLQLGVLTHYALLDLENDTLYELQLQAVFHDGQTASSAVVSAAPKRRSNCSFPHYAQYDPQLSFFCTWQAADEWLRGSGLDIAKLHCRNRQVTDWSVQSPNCLYVLDDQRILLLRSADSVFESPQTTMSASVVRALARQALWPVGDPFDAPGLFPVEVVDLPLAYTGNVTAYSAASSYLVKSHAEITPTVATEFTPAHVVDGHFAIYHGGHGGAGDAVEVDAETIDWLLERGWIVTTIDMPAINHNDFNRFDTGGNSPIEYFMLPVKAVVDRLYSRYAVDTMMMIGRSGGGWTTYTYSALDPRIAIVVSIAGGTPIQERLAAPWGPLELADYEQFSPHLYDVVGHEDLMAVAGTKGAAYYYNMHDPCCFQEKTDSAFVSFLNSLSVPPMRAVSVSVDEENYAHTLGAEGYVKLGKFLDHVLQQHGSYLPVVHVLAE